MQSPKSAATVIDAAVLEASLLVEVRPSNTRASRRANLADGRVMLEVPDLCLQRVKRLLHPSARGRLHEALVAPKQEELNM